MGIVTRIVKKGRDGNPPEGDIAGRVLVAAFHLWAEGHIANTRIRDSLQLQPADESGMLLLKNAYDAINAPGDKIQWLQLFSNVTQMLEERYISTSEASTILGL